MRMRKWRVLGAILLVLTLVLTLVVIASPSTLPEAMGELAIVEASSTIDMVSPALVADIMAQADVGITDSETLLVQVATLVLVLVGFVGFYSLFKQRASRNTSAGGTVAGQRRPRDCIQCEPPGA